MTPEQIGKINKVTNAELTRMGEAIQHCAEGALEFIRSFVRFVAAVLSAGDIEKAKEQIAINTAPPRVRYLAIHGKPRTRKKNAKRALREYKRR